MLIQLEYIHTFEGRMVPDGTGQFDYEYSIKDHLGNTRVMFDATIGRWHAPDAMAVFFPDVSLYQCVHNNPINRVDHFDCLMITGIGRIIMVIVVGTGMKARDLQLEIR